MNLKVYLNIVKMPNIARKINQDFCTQKNNNNKVILGNKNVCNFLFDQYFVWKFVCLDPQMDSWALNGFGP